MKTLPFLLATLGLLLAVAAVATGDEAIDELNMGLSKTSVFDTPTPEAFSYPDAKPGKNEMLPRAWEGIPPLIPHRVEMYLPIVASDNQCLDCHDRPQDIGKKNPSKPPMSRAHYASAKLDEVDGARFTCTQCHVPQADAPPLVGSTFR
jgi:cytochrome c-type protein NapB